jgi:hypothetical protein
MPNGPAGLNAGVKYGITGDPTLGDTVANLPARTQDAIKAELKANNIASGHSVWTKSTGPFGALGALFGLSNKGPFDAMLTRIGQSLLGLDISHLWTSVEAVFASLGTIPVTLTDHTEAIANLNTITSAMNTTAAYVGDQQDMVTAPRCLLVVMGANGLRSAEIGVPINIALYGSLATNVLPIIYPKIYYGATRGDIYFSPIVVDRRGTIDKIRWIVGGDTSIFSIDYYEVALCVYNPTNGNVEKVWGSGNIVDGVANTSTLKEVEISMGLTQHVTPGQILFVAHQQVGSGIGQSPRAFAAVPQAGVARPSSSFILNAASFRKNNYTQGIPSSIALSALTRENGFIPWAGVSVTS